MVERKLDGAVDESSVDQDIHKSDGIVNSLWKILRPDLRSRLGLIAVWLSVR